MFKTILRFRGYLTKYRWPLAAGALFTVMNAAFALAQPWPMKVIIDSVLKNKPINVPGSSFAVGFGKEQLLIAAIVAYLTIVVLDAVADFLGTWLMDGSGERMIVDVREALFARLQRLSLRYHTSQTTGDLISRVMGDIDRVQSMLIDSFTVLVPNILLLVGMITVMLLIDWQFTLIALCISPLLFLTVYRYTTRIKDASRTARKVEGRLASRTGEVLGAIRVVQAFNREDYEDERFSEDNSRSLAANLEAIWLQAVFSPLVDVLAAVGTAIVLFVGTHRVLSGDLSLGLLLVFLSYLGSLYKPMRQLSKLAFTTSKGVASAERIAEVLDADMDVADAPDAIAAPSFSGRVEFEGVSFGYTSDLVLHDIDLVAEPGQLIALVGPTGAGKSSLVGLIPRFFDPTEGRVTVDGVDIRSVQLRSLRDQVALVLQEPILFSGTIYDNIAYGRSDATFQEVINAAEAALVADFVHRLPDGYDTIVGERGATLSGGERQRISIARALVRDAPILILDEPTSAIDPESEQVLLKALTNLVKGRTTFVIAHRMSTIGGADQVLVLDEGRIIERGDHDQLMAISGGMYQRFLELQLGPKQMTLKGKGSPRRRTTTRATPRRART